MGKPQILKKVLGLNQSYLQIYVFYAYRKALGLVEHCYYMFELTLITT